MHLTIINHRIRKDLGLGCFQYMILDTLYQLKEASSTFIASALSVGEAQVEEKAKSLQDMEPALLTKEGEAWMITEYANKIMAGTMFVKERPKKIRPSSEMAERVIHYFNEINGTRYEPETYVSQINTILKSKQLTFEHFEAVIKHKYLTWGLDDKMKEYNRPKTLFGNKFMSYLDDARLYWEKKMKETADYSEISR